MSGEPERSESWASTVAPDPKLLQSALGQIAIFYEQTIDGWYEGERDAEAPVVLSTEIPEYLMRVMKAHSSQLHKLDSQLQKKGITVPDYKPATLLEARDEHGKSKKDGAGLAKVQLNQMKADVEWRNSAGEVLQDFAAFARQCRLITAAQKKGKTPISIDWDVLLQGGDIIKRTTDLINGHLHLFSGNDAKVSATDKMSDMNGRMSAFGIMGENYERVIVPRIRKALNIPEQSAGVAP